jgi:hypothetical protein
MASKDYQYVTTINDYYVERKTRCILIGESVFGEFFGVGEPLTTVANKSTEYIQPARPASKLLKRFRNPSFASSHMHFSLDKGIVDKLIDAGVRKQDLVIAHDAITQYINQFLKNETTIIFCISDFERMIFIEQITVVNGEVVNIKESKIEKFMFENQFPNHVRKEVREVGADIKNIKVCGPFLREMDEAGAKTSNEIWAYAEQDDFSVEVIKPFEKATYVDLFIGEAKALTPYYSASIILALGLTFFFGLTMYGAKGLQEAKIDYRQRIAGFEEIYQRGSSPIQLIEKRSLFLSEKKSDGVRANKLIRIVRGVAKLQNEQSELMPTIDRIKLNDLANAKPENSEFAITVSFFSQGKSSIKLVPQITNALLSQLGAELNVTRQPQRYLLNGKDRLRLTLDGTFCPNYKCEGATK